ncbi:hypothetical protein HMPREF9083_0844 [Dialister micraerophilus DSM 19965]|uniref:Uncharacterized protein n=1 Tax=Dialister micraerophilus DSM 19965 TaxID=888062 RepID=F2BXA2_9FIRM|nr:hypothetical protein HMPREF9083_0844 [Dialister micraerophilus DSM 19965]
MKWFPFRSMRLLPFHLRKGLQSQVLFRRVFRLVLYLLGKKSAREYINTKNY